MISTWSLHLTQIQVMFQYICFHVYFLFCSTQHVCCMLNIFKVLMYTFVLHRCMIQVLGSQYPIHSQLHFQSILSSFSGESSQFEDIAHALISNLYIYFSLVRFSWGHVQQLILVRGFQTYNRFSLSCYCCFWSSLYFSNI